MTGIYEDDFWIAEIVKLLTYWWFCLQDVTRFPTLLAKKTAWKTFVQQPTRFNGIGKGRLKETALRSAE